MIIITDYTTRCFYKALKFSLVSNLQYLHVSLHAPRAGTGKLFKELSILDNISSDSTRYDLLRDEETISWKLLISVEGAKL